MSTSNIAQQVRDIASLNDEDVASFNEAGINIEDLRFTPVLADLPDAIPIAKRRKLDQLRQYTIEVIQEANNAGESVVKIVLLAIFGWNPSLWKQSNDNKCLKASFFSFLFLADLADAVFDLILSIQTMIYGLEGEGIGFGKLLLFATILGRIVSGIYGWIISEVHENEEEKRLVAFMLMETTVFYLEDGAAILLLANSTDDMSIVETISMYLTTICGLCYTVFILRAGFGGLKRITRFKWFIVSLIVIYGGSFVFMSYILITQVMMSKADDPPLSGGLEIAAFVVYGIVASFGIFGMLLTLRARLLARVR
mmetsp:Transcript_64481/g.77425  ORF Transcript_64481/g.77425 Transcript_64481/m.77425 type:complete len:311 (+) Transcript_64481:156-1088(+)|eukprot:CAMPEP_0194382396 /NCGR_PEP_ID=MMETSP0174-20130528/60250_1 /TAXON_ID=216777 /ORGANISM="Proboscia alata, Strain PI-D3" /LENGTH=310 /DNA_ID=CAMNT_0039167681 /DNA_START=133 /DNA_END=1065 /DNA_ORIENTATION=+